MVEITDAMLDRERVFKRYRELRTELAESKKVFKKAQEDFHQKRKERDHCRRLTEIMIEYDCDSVIAKLRYEKELNMYTVDVTIEYDEMETDEEKNDTDLIQ